MIYPKPCRVFFRRHLALLLLSCGLLNAAEGGTEGKGPAEAPEPNPPTPAMTDEAILDSIEKGVDFLIGYQNENGSWGSATKTKSLNIYAPIPGAHHGFRTATTALCVAGLIENERRFPKAKSAIDRGEKWLVEHLPDLKRATPDTLYNIWGHLYSIQALTRMHERHAERPGFQARCRGLIRLQYEMLDRYESVDGGWGYYDFNVGSKQPASDTTSFMTAAVLVAMDEARSIGLDPPPALVERAKQSIHRQQKPDGSFLYGYYLKNYPVMGVNRPGGSLGRSQACHLALKRWGDESITEEVLVEWLERLFRRNGWLDIGRKRPIPHESWMQVAGYFYYFGHYYGALCIGELPEEKRGRYRALMAATLIPKQEQDGSWFDYPLYDYHRPYGTGYVLLSLPECLSNR